MKLRRLSLLLALVLLFSCTAAAIGPAASDVLLPEGLSAAYVKAQAVLAGQTPAVGSIGGEWAVIGLARSGQPLPEGYADDYYARVEAYMPENCNAQGQMLKQGNVTLTENARVALALTAIGKDPREVAGKNLLTALNDVETLKVQGVNAPIWALIALDSGAYEVPGREALVQAILDSKLVNGGWALSGYTPDPDLTGMALVALAPYYDTNEAVKKEVDLTLRILSRLQQPDGSFYSGGSKTCESSAQVVVALSALGLDAHRDEWFVKPGGSALDALLRYALQDGQFSHIPGGKANQMATEQGFYALVAYDRFRRGQNSLYDMTDIPQPEDPEIPEIPELPGEQIDPGTELGKLKQNLEALTVTQADFQTYAVLHRNLKNLGSLTDAELHALLLAPAYKEGTDPAYINILRQQSRFDGLLREARIKAQAQLDTRMQLLDKGLFPPGGYARLEKIFADLYDQMELARYQEELDQLDQRFRDKVHAILEGDLQVTFRLIGDSRHAAGAHEGYVTWIKTSFYGLETGSTVYDLTIQALNEHDMAQIGASDSYISSIQAPKILGDFWLGEFDNGPNSGWMYTLNGVHPDLSLKEQTLEDGDEIVWHYIDDYKTEETTRSWLQAADISPEEYVRGIGPVEQVSIDQFTDVTESDWFYQDVKFALEAGLFTGTGETTFSPLTPTSRAMLVTVLYRMEGKPAVTGSNPFTDVPPDSWFEDAVIWANESGIVQGMDSRTFAPGTSLTREQLAAILYRYAGFKGYDREKSNILTGYSDFTDLSVYALNAMKWANAEGLITGRGSNILAPRGTASRAEVCAILHRFSEAHRKA